MQESGGDEPEFTDEQLRSALRRVGRDARQEAFAAGRPVFFVKGASLVALHADGTEEIIKTLCHDSDAPIIRDLFHNRPINEPQR
ncbi:MAG TPA: hypothetical protein VH643_30325 [Gemmataceae bacterium]|jgi:hypothetical protein